MPSHLQERKREFGRKVNQLRAGLRDWFAEETEAIDGSLVEAAPSGSGGSIVSVRPAIDSKRVVDATRLESIAG